MNIRQTRKGERRVEDLYLSEYGIKSFGADNLYPQMLRGLINSSRNARTCVERRATYIEGNGITSQQLADAVVNRAGDTLDDIHHLVSEDVAYIDCIALHVNYDVEGRIVSLAHIPVENCRLCEPDEQGVVRQIAIHRDWRGRTTLAGKTVRVNAETIELLPVFDPRPEIVLQEIEDAGGIFNYPGQVLYLSRSGRNSYPLPVADVVVTDMSTDEGLANVNYRNVRNNFLPAGALITRRGIGDNESNDSTLQELANFQGDVNTGKLMCFTVETDEDKPEFMPFEAKNYDAAFVNTAKDTMESIYAAFNQESFARLRDGSIGFSSDIVTEVKVEYAQQVTKFQRLITRAYKSILERWVPGRLPYSGVADIQIEPLYKSTQDVPAN